MSFTGNEKYRKFERGELDDNKLGIRDIRNGSWFWVNKVVLEHPKLNSAGKLVYNALSYFANKGSQSAYPSISKMMELTNLSRPTIIKWLKKLVELNFISKEKQGQRHIYTLLKIVEDKPSKSIKW